MYLPTNVSSELIIFPMTSFPFSSNHPKKIYSLDNIYDSIWGDDAVGDSSIMVHIKNLRKKIGDSSREPIYIKTAGGRGYYVD